MISAEILKGAPAAAALCEKLSARAAALAERGITPCLCTLRVGERPDDVSYEGAARRRCEKLGIEFRSVVLGEDAAPELIASAIDGMNADPAVHGILMFRPLPRPLRPFEPELCERISPEKDVDGVTLGSMGRLYAGKEAFYPCTAQAVMELLGFYGVPLCGKKAVIVGRSLVIGRPVAMLLMHANATVTITHSHTEGIEELCRDADLIVAAARHTGIVTTGLLHPGQTVIDVGVILDEETQRIRGCVDQPDAERIVARISPVPGGVGSVTTSVLAAHVIEAAERQIGEF